MKILITAGPTREAIDPVRYISNRSSGKMGYSIAEAAIEKGHGVILVSGPVNLSVPEGVEFHPVESAQEMYEAVQTHLHNCQAAVFSAAVADYRVAEIAPEKIKKNEPALTLHLVKTADILGSCRGKFGFTGLLMGFAAETENLIANSQAKLIRKGCDFIVANDVSRKDIGFDQDENEVIVFASDGSHQALPIQKKRDLGKALIEILEKACQKV